MHVILSHRIFLCSVFMYLQALAAVSVSGRSQAPAPTNGSSHIYYTSSIAQRCTLRLTLFDSRHPARCISMPQTDIQESVMAAEKIAAKHAFKLPLHVFKLPYRSYSNQLTVIATVLF